MKVTAILKGKTDSNGQRAIYIRINDGNKRAYHATRLKVDPKQFEKGWVKPSHPKAKEFNQKIKAQIYQCQEFAIKEPKAPKVGLLEYIDTCLRQWDKLLSWGTLKHHYSQRGFIAAFSPGAMLSDVNVTYLYNIQAHRLKDTEPNTTLNTLKFLRKIILKAKSEGLITENPFERGGFKMPPYKQPKKTYLTKEEIEKIEAFTLNGSTSEILRHVGTWFLIGCATGLRISDLSRFNPSEHIVGNRVILYPEKGKGESVVSIPFSDRMRELFERINYKPLGISGQKYNPYLKAIAAAVGITKDMSSHIARHSMAMSMADAGISMEVAAAVLGHRDQRSTKVYYKISGKRIDDELRKME